MTADVQLFPVTDGSHTRSSQRTWLQEQEQCMKATTSLFHDTSALTLAALVLNCSALLGEATFPRHQEKRAELYFIHANAIVTSLSMRCFQLLLVTPALPEQE